MAEDAIRACPECGIPVEHHCFHDGQEVYAVEMPEERAAELRYEAAAELLDRVAELEAHGFGDHEPPRFQFDDRVWYLGPDAETCAELDFAPEEAVWLRAPGSTGKAYRMTREAVFVDWGSDFYDWVPRSHLGTYTDWVTAGRPVGYPRDAERCKGTAGC